VIGDGASAGRQHERPITKAGVFLWDGLVQKMKNLPLVYRYLHPVAQLLVSYDEGRIGEHYLNVMDCQKARLMTEKPH